MSQEITTFSAESALNDLQVATKMAALLKDLPHYKKLGDAGIFAITQKAKSIGMDPLDALNGAMYFVNGKVELQGQAMLSLIRKAGHSVKMDPKSTQTEVIMHGKRADNGDEWTATFSINLAKQAGIYKEFGPWKTYPQIMCMWRCVSILGRFLFSDVIKGCYVEGEISEAVPFSDPINYTPHKLNLDENQINEMINILEKCDEDYQTKVRDYIERQNYPSLNDMPIAVYDRIMKTAKEHIIEENNGTRNS